MLYGSNYFYLDQNDPNFQILDKVWEEDATDFRNLSVDNIYSTKEDAQFDRDLLRFD